MLVDVEALLLNTLVDTQTGNLLDTEEQYHTCHCCPYIDGKNSKTLCAEETEATTIECAAVYSEQTCHQGTEDTAHAMYGAGTYRVVDMELGVDKLNREHQ